MDLMTWKCGIPGKPSVGERGCSVRRFSHHGDKKQTMRKTRSEKLGLCLRTRFWRGCQIPNLVGSLTLQLFTRLLYIRSFAINNIWVKYIWYCMLLSINSVILWYYIRTTDMKKTPWEGGVYKLTMHFPEGLLFNVQPWSCLSIAQNLSLSPIPLLDFRMRSR